MTRRPPQTWTQQHRLRGVFIPALLCLAGGCASGQPHVEPTTSPASVPSSGPASAPASSPHGAHEGHGGGRGPALDADTVAASAVAPKGEAAVGADEVEAHVRALAADAMQGRGVGTEGLDLAADYVAAQFEAAGLAPAGDKGFFQSFEVTVGAKLADASEQGLSLGGESFALGSSWTPFAFSQSGSVTAPVVFAGYGVRAPELGYDDYKGIDVEGKVALVLRHRPARDKDGSPFASKDAARYGDLRFKAFTAKSQGAIGLIVINDPATYADQKTDVPYTFGGGAEGRIPVLHMTWKDGGERLAKALSLDLRAEQAAIDEKVTPRSRVLDGQASINVKIGRTRATVKNVVGVLWPDGVTEVGDAEVVVVGAHYDHLGFGGHGSLEPDSKEIHNGADDNASGTALLIELAEALASRRSELRRPIYFVAFTAEEIGLRGSEYWVTHAPVPAERIVAMMNFDMVGRLQKDNLYVGGAGTALEFERLIDAAADGQGLSVTVGHEGFGPSDHSAFYGRKIPVLFLFTGAHAEYHTPKDDPDLVNYEGIAKIGGFAFRALFYIAAAPERPFYTQADRKKGGDVGGSGSRGYGAYLGTVPSFAEFEGKGVKLQGVRDGSPADKAGIRGGDILVGMDDGAIDDLYEFTYALRERKPGDKVVIKVQRDGELLELEATLGERKKKK